LVASFFKDGRRFLVFFLAIRARTLLYDADRTRSPARLASALVAGEGLEPP
jgi:hypothetical protein